MERNLIGHYQSVGSDKVYIVSVKYQPSGDYAVIAKWGRRGGTMQSQLKGVYPTLGGAERAMYELFQEKMNKGYENIEKVSYKGPVTLNSVARHLEAESNGPVVNPFGGDDDDDKQRVNKNVDGVVSSLLKGRSGKIPLEVLRVRCVNNGGIEDRFELDGEYEAVASKHPGMLLVTNLLGEKEDCFDERFSRI